MADTKAYHVLELAAAAMRMIADLSSEIYEALDDDGRVDGWEGFQIGGAATSNATKLIPLIKHAYDADLEFREVIDGLKIIHEKLVSRDAAQWFGF